MTWALAIHGGAGLIRRNSLSDGREHACRSALTAIVESGRKALQAGGTAADVAADLVRQLEDEPLFNAGRGAVVAADGQCWLDAAWMCGNGDAGAVTGIQTTRNPISLARAVAEQTPHVLLMGADADALGRSLGLEQVAPSFHQTPERLQQWKAAHPSGRVQLDHDDPPLDRYGTVGAVVRDPHGQVCAASSTGGMVNKRPGRIGDTPVIGAGVFARASTAAISGTGHGEPFIRHGVAARVSAWMEIGGLGLHEACERVIHEELPPGTGGVIAVDTAGQLSVPFNTGGMFTAWAQSSQPEPQTRIWSVEPAPPKAE